MSNFLGKKISLISKALIRYEGVLYTIDQSAFTVALSKVKSFGTEDRPAERFIAARDEIYEYIIFRGSDISDLHVCDYAVCADDPIIVQIMSPKIANPPSPIVSSQLRVNYKDVNPSNSISHFHEPSAPVSQPQISINNRFMNICKIKNRSNENEKDYFNKQNKYDMPFKKLDSKNLEEIAANDYKQFKNRELNYKFDSNYEHNDENRQYNFYRRSTLRRGSRSNNSNFRGNLQNRGCRKVLPVCSIKDDFDFESSNALIAEEFANMDIGHVNVPGNSNPIRCQDDIHAEEYGGESEKIFYDKSKSFFDNISSEVSDRTENNSGYRNRRNNVETFGSSDFDRGGNRGFRGSRWNGGYRDSYGGNYSGFAKYRGMHREGRAGRTQFFQRRPFGVNGGMHRFGEEN